MVTIIFLSMLLLVFLFGFVVGYSVRPMFRGRRFRSNLFLRTYFKTNELKYVTFEYRLEQGAQYFTYNDKYYYIVFYDTKGNKFISEETYFKRAIPSNLSRELESCLGYTGAVTYSTLKDKIIITLN